MTQCPSDEQLGSLLDERIDGDELAAIEAHLEGCAHCQETLEALTYERFSATEWRSPAASTSAEPTPPAVAAAEESEGSGLSFLDPAVQAEQDSRRKRLILDRSPRQPSSFFVPPTEKLAGAEGDGTSTAYPPQVAGYDIVGRLGRGGMGVVYRARQHGLDRLVALKMLRGGSHADAETLARFRIEVRAVARLRHHNVVQVFDVGESHGLPYVSLELLEGGSLDARNGGTPQPESDAASLVATLARAVSSAHAAGIVHRDLKPANVLFSRDGVPKITDFGLAKRLDEDDGQTQAGQVMGSPSFMAPEQARGDATQIGFTSDIYALGAILYEMITGRPPFKGGSAVETLHQVVHVEPIAPSKLRPGLSRDLETICLKCLSKEPSKRYDSADSLAADLDRFLAGTPIAARRVHLVERGWKWARRQPAAAALAVVALGAIVALAGAAKLHADRVSRLRTEGSEVLAQAAQALARHDLAVGRTALIRYIAAATNQPALDRWRHEAETLLAAIEQAARAQKDEVETRLDEAQTRLNFNRFLELSRLAEVSDAHWLLSRDQPGGDPRPVRQAVEDALRLVGTIEQGPAGRPIGWQPTGPFARLSPSQRVEVDQACRALIWLWVESIGQAAPGEDAHEQARRALALFDRVGGDQAESKAGWSIRARLAASLGDRARADEFAQRARQVATVTALDRMALGRELQLAEQWTTAIGEFEASLQVAPDQFRARLALAICEMRANRPADARSDLTACLRRQPASIDLLLLRGVAGGAIARLRLVEARSSKDPAATRDAERLFDIAEADFQAANDLQPDDQHRLTLLLDRGVVRAQAGRFTAAEADFATAVRLNPTSLVARINWGQTLQQLGRTDEAVSQFDRAIDIEPTLARLYRARALARLDRRGSVDDPVRERVIVDLDTAIRLGQPGTPEVAIDLAQRARLMHQTRRFAAALRDADAALQIVPDQRDATLVRLQTLLALKRHGEVVQACDEVLARLPKEVDLWVLRGVARSNRQDFVGAIDDFTRALTLDPKQLPARVQRGWAYLVSDASTLALADFNAVIRQAPDHAEAYGGRGFALALRGQYQAAVADAEESIRQTSHADSRTIYNAARIYARSAEGLATESTSKPPQTATLVENYRDRALTLIRQAVDRLPFDRRQTFYRDVIQNDPALTGIRQRPQFARLAGQMGRPTQ